MQSFTISTLLTKEDFTKALLRQTYKKASAIIFLLLGIAIIGLSLFLYFIIPPPRTVSFDFTQVIVGLVIIVMPFLQVLMARKTTFKNPALQFPVEYTFTDDGLNVKGISFQSSFAWMHIVRVKHDPDFLLLFTNKTVAYFIKRETLTQPQIDFIKSKVKPR